jgi:F-type H+-transporting ATPase subunit gamma
MPSLKPLKTRIASVKSTRKTTKNMQLISASKLYKAREGLNESIPYQEQMWRTGISITTQ